MLENDGNYFHYCIRLIYRKIFIKWIDICSVCNIRYQTLPASQFCVDGNRNSNEHNGLGHTFVL